MNKITSAFIMLTALVCAGCDDSKDAPRIDSVWMNTAGLPAERISFAYPGQTICLRGEGFSDVRRVTVSGYEVNISTSLPYGTDSSLIIPVPAEIEPETDAAGFISVETGEGEYIYSPFFVKPLAEKPVIRSFSTTTLSAGGTLTVSGSNLDGCRAVYLPLRFGHKVRCHIAEADGTSVTVEIPEAVNFAKGRAEIVMTKSNPADNSEYEERVYSDETDFKN